MLRSAASKVAWVGRTASMVFGLALVMALVVGAASTAWSATGGNFILGKANGATTASKLTASIAEPALTLVNNSTAAAATALNISVASGKPPLKVNAAAGTATNLSADKLDGKNSGTYLPGDLPAGTTVRGNFYIVGSPSVNSEWFGDDISFGYRLPSPPSTHYIKDGEPVPEGCSGTVADPEAAPGHLCVFESTAVNVTADRGIIFPSRQGSGLEMQSAAAGSTTYAYGTWAVRAPN